MKSVTVGKIALCRVPESLEELQSVFDDADVPVVAVDCVNWADYPYRPQVCVRIAHTADAILLIWTVAEDYVRAMADVDNGRVWEDSCVEFFLRPKATSRDYYNIECNCVGRLLIGYGHDNISRVHAPAEAMMAVRRYTSINPGVFDVLKHTKPWTVGLYIPKRAFFKNEIDTFDGCSMTGNFYKCGDALPMPHFLSWNPVNTPAPLFHCPECFGKLYFE
jgi:hypothetical protein